MKNKQKLWRKNAAKVNKTSEKKHQGRKWKYLFHTNLGKLDTYPLLTKIMQLGDFNRKLEVQKVEPVSDDLTPASI